MGGVGLVCQTEISVDKMLGVFTFYLENLIKTTERH